MEKMHEFYRYKNRTTMYVCYLAGSLDFGFVGAIGKRHRKRKRGDYIQATTMEPRGRRHIAKATATRTMADFGGVETGTTH